MSLDELKIRYPEACIIHLKTGSPRLTVEWTREDGMISVVWFDGTTLCRDALHPDAIQF